jgi:hypothetical protein
LKKINIFVYLIISRQVTESKQKKTSSNAIISILHVLAFFYFSCEKKERNVYGVYSKKVELMCTVAQQRPRFSMVKKRKKKGNERELNAD